MHLDAVLAVGKHARSAAHGTGLVVHMRLSII
jgi:hypothetical protein